jgi:hypothetical protein
MVDNKNIKTSEEEADKMLGAFVPAKLFWEFKKAAAERKEKMRDAIVNAAYLYLDAVKEEAKQNGQK